MGASNAAGTFRKIQKKDPHLTFPPMSFRMEEKAAVRRLSLAGWFGSKRLHGGLPCGRFPHATQNRRMVAVVVNRSATSGSAALRALPSSLEDVTAFQLTRYSPA